MLSYKVLGDVFEALIGAIFVDSGGATSVVTGVIYRLLEREFGMSRCVLPLLMLEWMRTCIFCMPDGFMCLYLTSVCFRFI